MGGAVNKTTTPPLGLLLIVGMAMGAPWYVLVGLFVAIALTVSPA
jgi:hypothetical protein